MIKKYFVGLFLSVLLFACQSNPKFVGSWELVSLKLDNESITAKDLGNPSYTFHEDATYTIEVTGMTQEGTWELNDNTLTLIDKANPENKNELNIVEIEDKMFHYTAGSGETLTDVILKRLD